MKLRLLLLLLFCSTASFAQIQKEKGKLVFANGDTLNGLITYYDDNPMDIIYYNEQGIKEVFSTKEVNEINLDNGKKFAGRKYTSDKSKTTLMLHVLLESSKISLYQREENTTPYFYVYKDNTLYRLENNIIVETQDSRTYKREDKKYIGILSALMSDRMDLVKRLESLRLNESDLTKIILEYNQGDVTYYRNSGINLPQESNWVAFAQYSQFGSITGNEVQKGRRSAGQMVGVQYYFAKHSRHSIKMSFDYANYNITDIADYERLEMYGIGLRYEMAFKRTEKYNAYLLVHVADVAYASVTEEGKLEPDSRLIVMPRLSPGIGIEAKPLPKTAVYAEINNLLHLSTIPKSFSLGIKYDFGKTSW